MVEHELPHSLLHLDAVALLQEDHDLLEGVLQHPIDALVDELEDLHDLLQRRFGFLDWQRCR
jgi:hypothetical protein